MSTKFHGDSAAAKKGKTNRDTACLVLLPVFEVSLLGVQYVPSSCTVVKAVQAKRRKAKGKVMKRPPDVLKAKEKSEKRLVPMVGLIWNIPPGQLRDRPALPLFLKAYTSSS